MGVEHDKIQINELSTTFFYMDTETKIIGRCPVCGGNVVKTCKGYRCENNTGEDGKCGLFINGVIGNRKMADAEVAELLEKRSILLDGFATKEWKTFPTVLVMSADGSITMESVVARCPRCGGEIRVGAKAFNCSNYRQEGSPCDFVIWRNIAGHLMTLDEVREICADGVTSHEVEMFGENGSVYRRKLGLSPDKLKVIKV